MKRFSIILLTFAIALMAGTASVDAKKKTSSKKTQVVYYLVVASNTSLSEAIYERNSVALFMGSPIYVAKDNNGVTRYRTVYGKYSSREAANREKIIISDWGYDVWIWKSNGPAKCVDPGESHDF